MVRPEVEFVDYEKFSRKKIEGNVSGLYERVISESTSGSELVRILEFSPGTDTTPNGVQSHDYWEELYIIEGSVIDLSLNKKFSKGMVASRPPGMKHGPWKSPNGCIMFEAHYTKYEK